MLTWRRSSSTNFVLPRSGIFDSSSVVAVCTSPRILQTDSSSRSGQLFQKYRLQNGWSAENQSAAAATATVVMVFLDIAYKSSPPLLPVAIRQILQKVLVFGLIPSTFTFFYFNFPPSPLRQGRFCVCISFWC
jgi:hypothetical protein